MAKSLDRLPFGLLKDEKRRMEALGKLMRESFANEEAIRKSKRIVLLEEPPVLGTIIFNFKNMKQKKDKKFSIVKIKNEKNLPKVNKIVKYIEDEFIKLTLSDTMDLYKDCVHKTITLHDQQAYKTLQRFSNQTKIDLGKIYNIKGEFHETEDDMMKGVLEKLSKLYL